MCLFVDRFQSLDRNVRVQLRSCKGSVTEQLLDNPQIGSTFQHVSRGAMPNTVRREPSDIWHVSACLQDHTPHNPGIDPGTPPAHEQRPLN